MKNLVSKLPLALTLALALGALLALTTACGGDDSTASKTPSGSPTPTMVVGQATGTGSSTTTSKPNGTSSASPTSTSTEPPGSFVYNCPSNDTVVSALKIINDLGPDIGPHNNGIQCIYSASQLGASPIPQITIYFTPTTADAFARSESGIVAAGLGDHIDGVGDDAFTNPGELNVRKGGTEIQIIDPYSIPVADGVDRLKNLALSIVASIS